MAEVQSSMDVATSERDLLHSQRGAAQGRLEAAREGLEGANKVRWLGGSEAGWLQPAWSVCGLWAAIVHPLNPPSPFVQPSIHPVSNPSLTLCCAAPYS